MQLMYVLLNMRAVTFSDLNANEETKYSQTADVFLLCTSWTGVASLLVAANFCRRSHVTRVYKS